MTLDEAIKHCLEVAEQNETQAEKWQEEGGEQWGKTAACRECAADHRQLAEWLQELKEAKRLLRLAVEDIHSRDYCHGCTYESAEGKEQYLNCEYHNCFKWRYADEALKLIEG